MQRDEYFFFLFKRKIKIAENEYNEYDKYSHL